MILSDANSKQIQHLRSIFLCFEAVSRLEINLAKQEIVHVGDVEDVKELASILGCKVSSFPMKYWGLPLGASYNVIYLEWHY